MFSLAGMFSCDDAAKSGMQPNFTAAFQYYVSFSFCSFAAYAQAHLGPSDIDFFGLYDCFPICFIRAVEGTHHYEILRYGSCLVIFGIGFGFVSPEPRPPPDVGV